MRLPKMAHPGLKIDPMGGLAKILHNSIDALSLDDHRRQTSQLITGFIHRVNFGADFEKHLTFFVECRAAFPKLEAAPPAARHGM